MSAEQISVLAVADPQKTAACYNMLVSKVFGSISQAHSPNYSRIYKFLQLHA